MTISNQQLSTESIQQLWVDHQLEILAMEKILGWTPKTGDEIMSPPGSGAGHRCCAWFDQEGTIRACLECGDLPDLHDYRFAVDVAAQVNLWENRAVTKLTNENYPEGDLWGIISFDENAEKLQDLEYVASSLPLLLVTASLLIKDPSLRSHPKLLGFHVGIPTHA